MKKYEEIMLYKSNQKRETEVTLCVCVFLRMENGEYISLGLSAQRGAVE